MRDRTTGNWIVAAYRHDTSRELDPQLHTHAVAANLTYDGVEGRWKALQASGLYERRAYLTEVYRNALANEVRSLGYEIESRRDSRGRDLGFEIRGVSSELLERYSQRSAQRDAAIEEFKEQHGRKPTDNEVAVLVRESRADKLTEIPQNRSDNSNRHACRRRNRQRLDRLRAHPWRRAAEFRMNSRRQRIATTRKGTSFRAPLGRPRSRIADRSSAIWSRRSRFGPVAWCTGSREIPRKRHSSRQPAGNSR